MSSLVVGKGGRVPPPTRKLVIRKANSQRDLRSITERLTLEKVLGITSSSNAALACHPINGIVAYPAGCTVVLFNPRRGKQEFIHNVSKKTISALTFSKDGKYLATGESGHLPSVRVWGIEDDSHPQISEMPKGHKHGISCVAFSPNLKYLVSVGYLHDMLINVWNWKDGSTVACNKFSTKVYAISFSELGDFFVTSGVRHVKFWYFDTDAMKSKHDKTIPIKGRAGLLGELRNHTFCDVVCGVGSNSDYTYCVTTAGALCCFNAKRKLEKFVEIESSKALCMATDQKHLICGYSNGYIRVFDASSLEFIATLPKPHYLGVNVADGINPSHMIAKTDDVSYGDTVAIALDNHQNRLTCVYSDHSLYVWDISDVKKVGKIWSSLYHSACVWGLEVYPDVCQPGDTKDSPLPPGTFVTCSNDDTVRVWNIAEGMNISSVKNIYSKELLRILYVSQLYGNLKDPEMNPTSKNVRDVTSDSKGGVRCIRASHDGQLLAVGEKSGNVRIYDCMFLDEILNIDAHESEVLCIEFSQPESGYKLLASAGRDRLIHVFDINKEFTLIQTLDDHSASITSVKFSVDENAGLQLLSCSADKSVIFRFAQCNPDLQFVRNTNYVGKTTLYDMVIDSSRGVAAVACQDRNIRVYDSHTGKQIKYYKGAQSDDGTLVKITMDNSGYFAATSCSDKTLSLYEFDTGDCMATMSGHSEIVTGMRFTNDLKKLITVSGDGCIFIWTIPTTYTQFMTDRLSELGQELPRQIEPETPIRRGTYRVDSTASLNGLKSPSDEFLPGKLDNPPVADYRFSIGQLPTWAKKQLTAGEEANATSSDQGTDTPPSNTDTRPDSSSSVFSEHSMEVPSQPETPSLTGGPLQSGGPSQPGGRWAQRISNIEIELVTETSPQRPSSLPIDISSPEHKTKESNAWQEQVDVLANSPLERKCSLTTGEDDDLFSARNKSNLEDLKEEGDVFPTKPDEPTQRSHVVHEPTLRSRKYSGDLVFLQTEVVTFEQASEAKEDDMKENIIYFPQSQDEMESETAKSFQVTAAQKPERRSVGDDDQVEEKTGDKRKSPESSSDEEDDPLSATDEVKPEDDAKTSDKSSEADDDEGEEVCKKYFECLATSPTKETPPELEHKSPTPETNEAKVEKPLPFMNGRLSISARFLSRSLLSRGQSNLDPVSEDARASSLEEYKLGIQRRREEMARAVDVNRKRLTALRKAKEERELRQALDSPSTVSSVSITLKQSPRRTSLEMDPTSSAVLATAAKQHRSTSLPFPVAIDQPAFDLHVNMQPERLQADPEKILSTSAVTSSSSSSLPRLPLVTSLSELIPERDESVWKKRDSETTKMSEWNKKDEQKEKERQKENELQKNKENEVKRERDRLLQNEREKQQQLEMEKAKAEELLKEKQKEREKEKLTELEKAKEREREKERAKKEEIERSKQREMEKVKAEELLREKEKQIKREKEKQREIEKSKEKEREKEKAKKEETEKAKQREIEKAKVEELVREKQKLKEREKDAQRELDKAKEKDKLKAKQEEEKAKQAEKEIQKHKEHPKEKDKHEKKDEKEEKKDDNKENQKDKKDKKLEKRSSSSSLMAQTKSSWRKSLGFHGFSSKSKDNKKDDRRDSTPFASTLRSSDYTTQPTKRSDKVLFRDKKGKVSSEDRKSKSRSLGDLDSRLRPLREEIIIDSSSPPSRIQSTLDISKEVQKEERTAERPLQTPAVNTPIAVTVPRSSATQGLLTLDENHSSPSPPSTDRRSPIGKDGETKGASRLHVYQDAVQQLNHAIKTITDLHSQVLQEDHSDDKEEMLSLLTNTFTDTEEHCKQLRLQATEAFRARNASKPFVGNYSFSMNNLDTLSETPTGTNMNRRASEASVPTAVDQEAASDLLMRYSDILVEMVKQKLGN